MKADLFKAWLCNTEVCWCHKVLSLVFVVGVPDIFMVGVQAGAIFVILCYLFIIVIVVKLFVLFILLFIIIMFLSNH